MTSLEDLWRSVVSEVSRGIDVSPRILAVVESAVPQGIMGETLYLEVDSDFARDMIDQRARDEILAALTAVSADFETVNNFALVVNPSMRELDDEVFENPVAVTPRERTPETAPASNTRLNPKYTFDNFVIGTSNRFAHAAALAVAESPAKAYNPLFIYGGSGLGKTHLLHAIGHYAQGIFPSIHVRYVSSEEFTNDYINAIALGQMPQFNHRYRDVDLLLIDDIQFLGGKDATQDTFFHTFNTLHEHGKQVVITSDVPPKQLVGFEERMRSRKLLANASYFAFTATPKPKTLELFGIPLPPDDEGKIGRRPFHVYTMKQAIEEQFILNVLEYYMPVSSYYRLAIMIEADPLFDSKRARGKLRRYVESHDTAIRSKAEIMVDHFLDDVLPLREMKGEARAIVVTGSIERAVRRGRL
jgi:hypothetical protein